MTRTVPAQLCMGWTVPNGSAYLTEWTQQERLDFKHRLSHDLRHDVGDNWQLRWGGGAVQLEVNDDGSLPEIEVQAAIEAELKAHNQDPARSFDFAIASDARLIPAEVYYVIVNGTRVCVHNYGLQRTPVGSGPSEDPWTYSEFVGTPKAFTATIFMQLSWATPVP